MQDDKAAFDVVRPVGIVNMTSYRVILNETRRDLATAYIRDTELSFGEIAWLLGTGSSHS